MYKRCDKSCYITISCRCVAYIGLNCFNLLSYLSSETMFSYAMFSCFLLNLGEPKIALSSFDPLKINRMAIKQGGKSPVNVEINFNNVELHGLRNFVCTSVR